MPPSIPTHRPLLTATRGAILIAVVAVASSVFLALHRDAAANPTPAVASRSAWACPDTTATRSSARNTHTAAATHVR